MRILILPSEPYLTPDFPLGGVFQRDQALALQESGHEVGILSIAQYPTSYLLCPVRYDAIDNEPIPTRRRYVRKLLPERIASSKRISARLSSLARPILLRFFKEQWIPDILHAHNVRYAGMVARDLSLQTGIPYVITEHNSMYTSGAVPVRHMDSIRSAAQDCDSLIFVSEYLKNSFFKSLGIVRISHIIPNVLDERFELTPVQPRKHDRPITIVSAGSLDDNKNHAALIRAFARGFAGSSARLIIAGTGPKMADLKSLAQTVGVAHQIQMPGLLDREDLIEVMDASDCLAVTSKTETFGVIAIEALARGLRLVTTRCGGTEEIASMGFGTIVEQADEEGLTRALLEATAFQSEEDRNMIRKKSVSEFGRSAFARRLLSVYQEVLDQRGSSH